MIPTVVELVEPIVVEHAEPEHHPLIMQSRAMKWLAIALDGHFKGWYQ